MVQEARTGVTKNTRFQSWRPKGGQMDLKRQEGTMLTGLAWLGTSGRLL